MMRRPAVLAVLLAAASVTFGPRDSQAQDEKRAVVPRSQGKPTAEPGKPKGPEGPGGPNLGGERFVRRNTEVMAEAKWQEAFKLLKKLIESTSDEDPSKPDLFYRLSEMYWERASAVGLNAFAREEECLEKSRGNAGAEDACTKAREAAVASTQQYRDQAIKIYKHIVQKYPRYPRLDGVLFALGYNFQQKGEPDSAKRIYIELIKRYPNSEHIADTLLNVGEIYFDAGQVDDASVAYGKVVSTYPESSVYGYALYKLAWCAFNQNRHTDALKYFLKVVEHTNDMRRSGQAGNRLTLKKEALRDLVRTYVNIDGANPVKAVDFFRRVAPDDYLDLAERLAELYSDTGQFQKSNSLYRELIRLQPNTYKAVSYQIKIAYNTGNIGQQIESVRELKRLVTLWSTVKDAKDADPARVAKDKASIEEQLRRVAVTYHTTAIKTKNPNDYALAYELYSDYVKVFPEGPEAYTMTFYFAELLYDSKKWQEAARNYERALELNPTGEFTKDAAHGTVLAYKKLLLDDTKGGAPSQKGGGGANAESVDIPEPQPISEDYERFIKACDLYKKYVDKSEYLVDIEYDAARIYYDLNHFDKAAPRFKDIAENHQKHRLAIYAANLLLDIYNLQKNFDELEKQADTFLRIYPRDRDPEFNDTLVTIKQQSTFKRCSSSEASKEYRKSARCYLNYAKKFPQSKFVDKALYNASLNLEREKLIEQSIQTKLELINNYKSSELVPKALYQIAGNLHALAIYSEASKAYEYYAEQFPDRDEAKDALRFAAIFRQGLGQMDEAIADARAYVKIIGTDKAKAAEVQFTLGMMFEKQGKWDEVIRHYQRFLKDYAGAATPDLIIEAHTRIGNAYMAEKKPDERKAQKAYEAAYSTFSDLSDEQKQGLTTGRSAVAEARFKQGEAIFREFEAAKLRILPYKNVTKYVTEMSEKIKARTEVIIRASKIYNEVIQFQSPNWAIAALARIGQMYQAMANDVYEAPAPGSFDEEQKEVFKGAMAERATVPEGKAVEAYVICMKKAQELRWFNEWSDLAERQLARLNPQEYRYNAEIRARPDHFGGKTIRGNIVTELKVEDDG